MAVDLHHWLAVFHPLATIFYLVYCGILSFFLPLAIFALLARRSRLGAALAFPALWTLIEYLRTEALFRFGFGGLAYSQAFSPLSIQMTDITGVYGLTWLIAAVNVALWIILDELLFGREFRGRGTAGADRPRDRCAVPFAGLYLLLLAGSLVYGAIRLGQPLVPSGLKVELAQYDHPNRTAYDENEEAWLEEYRRLVLAPSRTPVDLVVLPENAVLRPLSLDPARQPEGSVATLNRLSGMAREAGRSLLVGVLETARAGERDILHNSALLFDAGGDLRGRYRKRILAPFGETDPLGGLIPAFDRLILELTDAIRLTPGATAALLRVEDAAGREHPFGLLICYEGTSGDLVRGYSVLGAEFLVNITSDRWTGDIGALRQHAAFTVFRAVENRKSLVRVGNGGLSFAIDPLGRVVAELPVFTTGAASWEPSILLGGTTFYARTGDWILVFALLAAVAGITLAFIHIGKHSHQGGSA